MVRMRQTEYCSWGTVSRAKYTSSFLRKYIEYLENDFHVVLANNLISVFLDKNVTIDRTVGSGCV